MANKFLDDVGLSQVASWVKTSLSEQKTYIDTNDQKSAKSDYGYLTDSNLLTWAQTQTRSGSFGVQKNTTTQGVPVSDYFIGYLDVVSTTAKRIMLSSRVNGETYINTWYNSAWTGWHHLPTTFVITDDVTAEKYMLGISNGKLYYKKLVESEVV